MKPISIYTITSQLHEQTAVDNATRQFLESLGISYHMRGNDFSDYGQNALDLIFIRTGGTEGQFKQLLPQLSKQAQGQTIRLLASDKSNSLAASMEILSYLNQQGLKGEIIHGSAETVSCRLKLLAQVGEARRKLREMRLGIVGAPSDWLISSHADSEIVSKRWGINLVEIPMDELLKRIEAETLPSETDFLNILDKEAQPEMRQPATPNVEKALPGAIRIYKALKNLVVDYRLDGFTLRCFDLLGSIHNTGCLALALLNAEGIVAGCEGDVPAMISMAITNALIGKTGFQANPARIDTSNGEMWFAHCTIPLNMVQKISLDTHFESGIGVGICGSVEKGPITIFKTDADGERFFAEEGMLNACPSKADLCRTQMVISLSRKENTSYFLTNPIGNHHIIVAGHHKNLYEEMMMG